MDENQPATTMPTSDTTDTNLPAVIASMETLTVDVNLTLPGNKRVLRKRVPKPVPNGSLNRRCSLRPKKRTYSDMETEEDIKGYYLNTDCKRKLYNLETIFEEKHGPNGNNIYMSAKKYKRMIQFHQIDSDSKVKKRRAKVKKVFGTRINIRKYKATSMEKLLDKLSSIRAESPAKIDNEVK